MAEMKPVASELIMAKLLTLASTIKSEQGNAKPQVLKATDDGCLIAAATLLAANADLVSFRREKS